MFSRAFKVLTICRHCVASRVFDLHSTLFIQELLAHALIGLEAYLMPEINLNQVLGTSFAINDARYVP